MTTGAPGAAMPQDGTAPGEATASATLPHDATARGQAEAYGTRPHDATAQGEPTAAPLYLAVLGQIVDAVNARAVPEHLLAPGFRMENRVSAVTDYEYFGAVGFRDWMRDLFEMFADGARYEVGEVIAAGSDFVVAAFRISGAGALSREPLEFSWIGVTWFRGGRVARAVGYAAREQALAALQRRADDGTERREQTIAPT